MVGKLIDYVITVTNSGPATATGVTFILDLPPSFTLTFFSGTSPFSCTAQANRRTCTFGTMESGSVRTATFRGRPTVATELIATVTVSAQQPDPNPGNNAANVSTSTIAACASRPRVSMSVVPDGTGRLRATLTAGPSTEVANNRFRTVRFTRLDNVEVQVPGFSGNAVIDVDYVLTGGPQSFVLTLRRKAAGPFTAQVSASDRCGPWLTVAGGGINVP